MFEVKVKVGSRLGESVVSLTTSSTGYIRCKKLLKSSASYECKNKSEGRDAQLVSLGMLFVGRVGLQIL